MISDSLYLSTLGKLGLVRFMKPSSADLTYHIDGTPSLEFLKVSV